MCLCIFFACLLLSALPLSSTCPIKDAGHGYNHYTIYLKLSDDKEGEIFLVLTRAHYNTWGGQQRRRLPDEPILSFEFIKNPLNICSDDQVMVSYHNFADAIESDQPSHNVRVFIGNTPILLSKIIVRQFRNGLAGKRLSQLLDKYIA